MSNKFLACVLFPLILLVACTSPTHVVQEPFSATNQATIEILPASITLTPSPIYTSSSRPANVNGEIPTHTPSPATSLSLVWAEGLKKPISIDNFTGVWSPTANEMAGLYWFFADEPGTLALVSAPDFQTRLVKNEGANLLLLVPMWSSDGHWILFGDHTLSVMDSAGKNIRQVPGFRADQFLSYVSIMGNRTIVTSEYEGGGYWEMKLVDFLDGELIASVISHEAFFKPNSNYVPAAMGCYGLNIFFVISLTEQPQTVDTDCWSGASNHIRLFSEEELQPETTVHFRDWMPGSNQMLVQVIGYDQNRQNIKFTKLLIWDVDQNRYGNFYPGGIDGNFSPDGKKLALISRGPVSLYKDNQIISAEDREAHIINQYFQLLDISSGEIFIQFPVIQKVFQVDISESINMSFSPDSRYLAFLTPGEIKTDENGWPKEVISYGNDILYLNVIDLVNKKLILSVRRIRDYYSSDFVWSHNDARLVYADQDQNWIILNPADGLYFPLTVSGGGQIHFPTWSFDDKYLYFSLNQREPNYKSTAIVLEIPGTH